MKNILIGLTICVVAGFIMLSVNQCNTESKNESQKFRDRKHELDSLRFECLTQCIGCTKARIAGLKLDTSKLNEIKNDIKSLYVYKDRKSVV